MKLSGKHGLLARARRSEPMTGGDSGLVSLHVWPCRTLLLCSMLLCQATAARADNEASVRRYLAYLVECITTGADGMPAFPTKAAPGCKAPLLTRSSAPWLKIDWPSPKDGGPIGNLASRSYLLKAGANPLVAQTLDYGRPPSVFGRFDRSGGDGGDVVELTSAGAYIPFTEDGSGGEQWFIGQSCSDPGLVHGARHGWLLFGSDVSASVQARMAHLRLSSEPDACPDKFSDAYTLFWRQALSLPFRTITGTSAIDRHVMLDAIISEHYARSLLHDHMERFYFAEGLGKVRWERWENRFWTRDARAVQHSRDLATTGRCKAEDGIGAPNFAWLLVDCRMWTVLVPAADIAHEDDYGWPALPVLSVLERP